MLGKLNYMIHNAALLGCNFDARDYLKNADPRGTTHYTLTRSDLMEFAQCPSRWINGTNVEDDTESTIWGSLVDCLLTDADRFSQRFVIRPSEYPVRDRKGNLTGETKPWNANSDWCSDWLTSQGALQVVSLDNYNAARLAVRRITQDPEIASILASAKFQMCVTGTYLAANKIEVPVKALVDIVPDKSGPLGMSLIDLKTTKNASPASWHRTCNQFNYHVQGAMQLDLWNAATGENRNEFRHIAQENFDPFEVAKHCLDASFIELGRSKYQSALELYARCIETNHWPTYSELSIDQYAGWAMISPDAWMAGGLATGLTE